MLKGGGKACCQLIVLEYHETLPFTEIDGSALGASFGRVSCLGKENVLKN